MTMDFESIAQSDKTRYIGYLLTVALAAYLLSNLAVFYTKWSTATVTPAVTEQAGIRASAPAFQRPLEHYRAIWTRNLFSIKSREDDIDQTQRLLSQLDQLDITSLNCTLVGTIIREGGDSVAIIVDNQSGQQERLSVGDSYRGAEIVMILRNLVILNVNGKNERLVMGIEKIRSEDKTGEVASVGAGDVETFNISRDFMAKSVNNIAQIMSTVRVMPHFEDGEPSGFLVTNIRDESILKTMGFKDGDVINSVNGQSISSAEDVMRLYGTLKDSSFFGIGIVRDGRPKTLNFKVR